MKPAKVLVVKLNEVTARIVGLLTGLAFLRTVRISESLISATPPIRLGVELSVADTTSQTRFKCPAALAGTRAYIA